MPTTPATTAPVPLRHRLSYWGIRAVIGAMRCLPYRWRVPAMGWLTAHVISPLLGWNRRIRANLAHVLPDLPEAEVRRLVAAVPDNWGRTLIEAFSGDDFIARAMQAPLTGPGIAAFEEARAAGRRVILVTGHFGNYETILARISRMGHPLAALYREMEIVPFNEWYAARLGRVASPVFPASRRGIAGFVRHLKEAGLIGILTDVHAGGGAPVTFFGKVAPTATSVGEWALKYDAVVIPIYARRLPDGMNFEIFADAPVPHGDPVTMTQALNDSLERMVRREMGQWFWIHRRWKPERRGEGAAP